MEAEMPVQPRMADQHRREARVRRKSRSC